MFYTGVAALSDECLPVSLKYPPFAACIRADGPLACSPELSLVTAGPAGCRGYLRSLSVTLCALTWHVYGPWIRAGMTQTSHPNIRDKLPLSLFLTWQDTTLYCGQPVAC